MLNILKELELKNCKKILSPSLTAVAFKPMENAEKSNGIGLRRL